MQIRIRSSSLTILSLAILMAITITSRLVLFTRLETLYYVDSYHYLDQAILMSEGKGVALSRGAAFVSILGGVIKLTSDLVDPVTSAKLFMIVCSVALVFVFYLLSKQFLDATPAFFATLLASLETSFIFYSLVPYLEILAFLAGFCSLYVLTSRFSDLSTRSILASLFVCSVSIFTRFEMVVVFLAPLSSLLLVNWAICKSNRKVITIIFVLFCAFLLSFAPQLVSYYSSITRFSPVERLFLALRWDILGNAFDSLFSIGENELLVLFFKVTCLSGLLHALFAKIVIPSVHRYRRHKSIALGFASYFDRTRITVFSVVVSFAALLIVAVAYYAYSYRIMDGELAVSPVQIGRRFLIGPQLYLAWPFAYSLSKVAESISKIASVLLRRIGMFVGKDRPFLRNEMAHFSLLLVWVFLVFPLVCSMWIDGLALSGNAVETMGLYRKSAEWLSNNLKDEVAIVPLATVFHIHSPDLKNKTIPYSFFWDKAGIKIRANNTREEYDAVRKSLVDFIMQNNFLKYVVVDWMDGYCRPILYDNTAGRDEIVRLLRMVHEESMVSSGGWIARIRVYEIAQSWEPLFHHDFSVLPERHLLTVFGNCAGDFTVSPEGLSLHLHDAQKGSIVQFHFSPPSPIVTDDNAIIAVSAKFKVDSGDSNVEVELYFDKNRDGAFGGYVTDYSRIISRQLQGQSTSNFNLFEEMACLGHPIVQISMRFRVNEDIDKASLTVSELSVFGQ